jgi:hypothetical protein
MKQRFCLLLSIVVLTLASVPAHAQHKMDPFDDQSLFIGYRFTSHQMTNPYLTGVGIDGSFRSGSEASVTSWYMPFGRMYFGFNQYTEVSTYAIDLLYQLIFVGSDVELSSPFIDKDKTMRFAEHDFIRYMISSDWDSLPVSMGFQFGIANYGIYGQDVADKARDGRGIVRFDNTASLYYGLNVGRSFEVWDGRHLYTNVQYDWHLLYKGSDNGSGNRLSAQINLYPLFDSFRLAAFYRQNETPYLKFQGVDATYKNRSVGIELVYHISRN